MGRSSASQVVVERAPERLVVTESLGSTVAVAAGPDRGVAAELAHRFENGAALRAQLQVNGH